MKTHLIHFLCICWIIIGLTACSEKDDVSTSSFIVLSEQEVSLGINSRYYEVDVACADEVKVWTDADWIEISEPVVSSGITDFYISQNEGDEEREATIVFQSSIHPEISATLCVRQKGRNSLDDNALAAGELTANFRVGYGYNIFQEYESERSMTEAVLNYDKLVQTEKKLGYPIIQEDQRSSEQIEYLSGYSLEELSKKFSESSESTSKGWLGATKTIKKITKDKDSHMLNEECYGYARLKKITSSRYLDEAALEYLINEEADVFTEEFAFLHQEICKNPNRTNINKLFSKFGTHLVVSADLGGMVEYMVNFKKSEVLNIETYTEVTSKYIFGLQTSDSYLEKIKTSYSSSYSANKALTITGGDPSHIQTINDYIKSLNNDSQLPQSILSEWMNALEGDYVTDSDLRKRLAIVGCNTIPIWQLFKDKNIRDIIVTIANERAEEYSLTIESSFTDRKKYGIPITEEIFDFTHAHEKDGSLVKVLYANKEPILEICNEYVPQIRQDKRVNIIYPIINGQPNLKAGLYLSENKKDISYVAFSNNDFDLLPLTNTDMYTGYIYYIDGTLYLKDMGTNVSILTDPEIKCEYSRYFNENYRVTIRSKTSSLVKIGSKYWTETPIDLVSGRLPEWYKLTSLPTTQDFEDMLEFLNGDIKSLFKGQISGFDTNFPGIREGYPFGTSHYSGQKCFYKCLDDFYFAFTKDYKIEKGKIGSWHVSIREIRPADYRYPTLE